jgi:integrase
MTAGSGGCLGYAIVDRITQQLHRNSSNLMVTHHDASSPRAIAIISSQGASWHLRPLRPCACSCTLLGAPRYGDAAMRVRLTDKFCAAAKSAKQTDYFDENVSGLALRVSPTAKAWTLHHTKAGKRARLTLGRYPQLSLSAARAAALEAKAAIANGTDPRPSGAGTLRSIVDEYFRREGSKLRTVVPRRAIFDTQLLPVLGDRPIGDIRRSEIVRLLDEIEDNRGPRAAGLAYAYLGRVMGWWAGRDDEFRSPLVRGMARPQAKARDRTLTDDELRAFWKGTANGDVFDRYLRFLLLTATRRSEAAKATRAEIVDGLWIIPARRMKSKVEYVVPLSAAAMALLPAAGECFPRIDFCRHKQAFDRATPLAQPWTLHDLRRTARSLLSRAGISADVAERCLAHTIQGVRATYDRHAYLEEKRQAFEALASLVQRIVDPQPNVVTLRG